jgi:hypothetical protein
MNTKVQAAASTGTPAVRDQIITTNLNVEIMTDLDTGEPTLLTSTEPNQGDLQVATVVQALNAIAESHAKLDEAQALVDEYADKVMIPAFLAEFGIQLEEFDPAALAENAPHIAADFGAFCEVSDGHITVTLPKGQKPSTRFIVIRALVLDRLKRGQA